MKRHALSLLLLGLAAACSTSPASAQARWLQTVEVIAPVDEFGATGVLLDSLVQAARRGDIPVRREPEAMPRAFAALEDEILNEGLDFTSANRVFLAYRLEATPRGFTSQIESFYFIYRPEGHEGLDLPILYVDGREPAVQQVLTSGGIRLATNEAAVEPFYDQMAFHRLEDAVVVEVGGRVIRDAGRAEAEHERLLATVRRFVY